MDMATVWGTPARIMFRTAVRRRSWNSLPGTLAFLQAVAHAFRKSPTGAAFAWKTCGEIAVTFSGVRYSRACRSEQPSRNLRLLAGSRPRFPEVAHWCALRMEYMRGDRRYLLGGQVFPSLPSALDEILERARERKHATEAVLRCR